MSWTGNRSETPYTRLCGQQRIATIAHTLIFSFIGHTLILWFPAQRPQSAAHQVG